MDSAPKRQGLSRWLLESSLAVKLNPSRLFVNERIHSLGWAAPSSSFQEQLFRTAGLGKVQQKRDPHRSEECLAAGDQPLPALQSSLYSLPG